MSLAKASSILAKFEILTCKNYSFHGNGNVILSNSETMEERFPNCGITQLQAHFKENKCEH